MDFRNCLDPFWGFTQSSEFMIPEFHNYSLEPKITKCGDLLYSNWEVLQCIWSNLWYSYDGEMKSQMESNMKGLRATYNVFFLTFFYMPSSTVQCIEVQVCTFLQHIWSNVQLSMGYLLKEFSEFHFGENILADLIEIFLVLFWTNTFHVLIWFHARYPLTVYC